MEPKTGDVHVSDGGRSVQTHQNISQLFGVLAHDTARVVVFLKAFEAFVAERPDHTAA
jgi:hypothetical protein